jgi:hypothetical protein
MSFTCVNTSRRIFIVDTRHVYPYRRLYMDDQLIGVFVPIRQSEQHTVDRLHLIEWSKHSATDNVYAELKQIVNCMEIHVWEHINIWK